MKLKYKLRIYSTTILRLKLKLKQADIRFNLIDIVFT